MEDVFTDLKDLFVTLKLQSERVADLEARVEALEKKLAERPRVVPFPVEAERELIEV